jgi:hypothetical protein
MKKQLIVGAFVALGMAGVVLAVEHRTRNATTPPSVYTDESSANFSDIRELLGVNHVASVGKVCRG